MIPILHEDADLLVVDKPAGLDIEALGPTLAKERPELNIFGPELRYGIAHRLDKDTSGVLLVAKNKESLELLQAQFKNREIQKEYIALAHGIMREPGGLMDARLNRSPADRRKQRGFLLGQEGYETARDAVTEYEVQKRYAEGFTLLRLFPKTGRKHQIRAHLAHKGFPLAGDALYGFKGNKPPTGLERQFLHAISITIPGKTSYTAPLPKDLGAVLSLLTESPE
ncbi:MAG: RluA family pseudouridine synthase [Candidatus Wildermuthbacteria bacterium]|nr:RluA family pseudouridine synthase [Candidatus Wildermuthbacteria bacterium]